MIIESITAKTSTTMVYVYGILFREVAPSPQPLQMISGLAVYMMRPQTVGWKLYKGEADATFASSYIPYVDKSNHLDTVSAWSDHQVIQETKGVSLPGY